MEETPKQKSGGSGCLYGCGILLLIPVVLYLAYVGPWLVGALFSPPDPKPAEIAGMYVYKLYAGEVEVLTLSGDLTFKHELYNSVEEFIHSGTPRFSETGKYKLDGKGITLNWDVMVVIGFPQHATHRTKPARMTGVSGYFGEDEDGHSGALVMAEDMLYSLCRIQTRDFIKNLNWQYNIEPEDVKRAHGKLFNPLDKDTPDPGKMKPHTSPENSPSQS